MEGSGCGAYYGIFPNEQYEYLLHSMYNPGVTMMPLSKVNRSPNRRPQTTNRQVACPPVYLYMVQNYNNIHTGN